MATEIERLDQGGGGTRIVEVCGGKSLHEQSHGESFFALFMNRLRGDGLYLLDEPEAALSPTRQLAFLARLHDLIEQGCQFIIATHSPILLAFPDASIYLLADGAPRPIAYQDTEHYSITRSPEPDRPDARCFAGPADSGRVTMTGYIGAERSRSRPYLV